MFGLLIIEDPVPPPYPDEYGTSAASGDTSSCISCLNILSFPGISVVFLTPSFSVPKGSLTTSCPVLIAGPTTFCRTASLTLLAVPCDSFFNLCDFSNILCCVSISVRSASNAIHSSGYMRTSLNMFASLTVSGRLESHMFFITLIAGGLVSVLPP